MRPREGWHLALEARQGWMLEASRRLIAAPSHNPNLDTRAAAAVAAELVREAAPAARIDKFAVGEGVTNLVAVLSGRGPGRRVVISGHLDTYPLLEQLPWTVDPLGGEVGDGRIYG